MKKLSLLIIAYQRPNFLRETLANLPPYVDEVFISLDYPANLTSETNDRHLEIIDLVAKFQSDFQGKTKFFSRSSNVGCSAAVVSSCDWFYSHVDYGAVLEDDCIPSSDFFDLILGAKDHIKDELKILLACGHQVAPAHILGESWALSNYPLIWGWGTSAEKWLVMKSLILSRDFEKATRKKMANLDMKTFCFFRAGARRSFQGYMDAWDAPLLFGMLANGYSAILPPRNLIKNVGNDSVAVHTIGNSKWLNAEVEPIDFDFSCPTIKPKMELWLNKKYFRISFRHIFSTKVTYLLDLVRKPKYGNLSARISSARIDN